MVRRQINLLFWIIRKFKACWKFEWLFKNFNPSYFTITHAPSPGINKSPPFHKNNKASRRHKTQIFFEYFPCGERERWNNIPLSSSCVLYYRKGPTNPSFWLFVIPLSRRQKRRRKLLEGEIWIFCTWSRRLRFPTHWVALRAGEVETRLINIQSIKLISRWRLVTPRYRITIAA